MALFQRVRKGRKKNKKDIWVEKTPLQ